MATKSNGFENGVANGSNVTISNSDDTGASAFSVSNAGSGGTITYDNAVVMHGAQAGKFDNNTTSNPSCVAFADTVSTSFAGRVYFYLTALPATSLVFGWRLQTDAPGQSVKSYLTDTGLVTILNSSSVVLGTGAVTLSTNTWYRWEFYCSGLNSSSGDFTSVIYAGDSLTPTDTVHVTGQTTTTNVAEARFGKNAAGTVVLFYVDDIAVNIGSATPLGLPTVSASPAAADADATGTANDAQAGIKPSADFAAATGTANNATISNTLTTSVSAGVASATVDAPFDPAGGGISLDYLVDAAVEAIGSALDPTTLRTFSIFASLATGAANDATITSTSFTNPAGAAATATGAAFDAFAFISPGVFPLVVDATGTAFDATVLSVVAITNVNADPALAIGEAFDTTTIVENNIFLYFTTPTVKEKPYLRRHRLWDRTYLDRGQSILKFGTSYQQIDNPSAEQIETADAVYVGGRTYRVTEAEGNHLRDAGYSAYITGPFPT